VNTSSHHPPARIAYLSTHYPGVTHTFIQREVLALRQLGHEVVTFAINTEIDVHSDIDRAEFAKTRTLKGRPVLWTIRTILTAILTHPVALAATLLEAWRGVGLDLDRRGRRTFQVGEALLLERMCREDAVEHIHAHFGQAPANIVWFAALYFNRCNRGRTMTWSVTIHGPQDCLNEPTKLLQRKMREAAFIIAVSDFTKAQLLWKLPPDLWERVHVVRCGVDLSAPIRPVGGRPDSPFTALVVARLSAEKGHGVAFEALAAMKDRGHQTRLVLVGPGDYEAEFGDIVDTLGVRDRVKTLGAVEPEQVVEQMLRADVLIVPSFAEGLPVVIMEAMVAGLPVVASGIAGVPELVEHEVTGLLVVPARPDLLADALERVMLDPALARTLAIEARRRVEQLHDEATNIRPLAEHFQSAVHP
jgi:colanic acid/amylovoran biosynthesis glycosyltransferase